MYRMQNCSAEGWAAPDIEKPEPTPTAPQKFIGLPRVPKAKIFNCELKKEELPTETEEQICENEASTSEGYVDIETFILELDRIKNRLGYLDKLLDTNSPECPPPDSCFNADVELSNARPEIKELQSDNHKLKQQLAQLQLYNKASKANLKLVQDRLCEELTDSKRLQRRLDELNSFKLQLERRFMLCAQRFRYLNDIKYDWGACFDFILEHRKMAIAEALSIVRKPYLMAWKKFAKNVIVVFKLRLLFLHKLMSQDFKALAEACSLSPQDDTEEIRSFLNENAVILKKYGLYKKNKTK